MALTMAQAYGLREETGADGLQCPYVACYRRIACDGERCVIAQLDTREGDPPSRVGKLAGAAESAAARKRLAEKVRDHGLENVAYALGLGRAKTRRALGGGQRLTWALVDAIEALDDVGAKYATAEDLYRAGAALERIKERSRRDTAWAARAAGLSYGVACEALRVHAFIEDARQPTLFGDSALHAAWTRAEDFAAELSVMRSSVAPALGLEGGESAAPHDPPA